MIDIWKLRTCKTCNFRTDAPRGPGPVDLKQPKISICRYNPPSTICAIAEGPQGPFPMPLTTMYPLVNMNQAACSHYKEENNEELNIDSV